MPGVLLSDGYLANGVGAVDDPGRRRACRRSRSSTRPGRTATGTEPGHESGEPDAAGVGKFLPYKRDEYLSRPWAIPGTPGLEHRIGGIEKQDVTGNVNYEPANHEHMVHTRAKKIANIAETIPDLEVTGPTPTRDLLVVGWGGTYGCITTAVERARRKGLKVAQAHLRYLNPMPKNTEAVLKRFKKVLVPELNTGQLCWLLRAKYLVPAEGLNKVQGKPFLVSEIEAAIEKMLLS